MIKFKNYSKKDNAYQIYVSSILSLGLRLVGMLFVYLLTVIITRNFGARTMGLYSLSLTVISIAVLISCLGMDTAMLKMSSKYLAKKNGFMIKKVYKKCFFIVLSSSILISTFIFIFSNLIANSVFNDSSLSIYLKISSLAVIPFSLMFLSTESLRGLRKIKEYVFIRNVIPYFVALITLILLIFVLGNYLSPIISIMVGIWTSFIFSFFYFRKHSAKLTKGHNDEINYRKILSLSLPFLFASSLFMIMEWTDKIMLGIFGSSTDVGIYAVSAKIASVTILSLFAINSIVAPKFSEFYTKNKLDKLFETVKYANKLILLTSLPIAIIIFLFPEQILNIFGSEFASGKLALLILTIGFLFNALSGSVGYLLQMTDNQKTYQTIILISALLNVILNWFLIPRFGVNGAAFASMISMIFWNLSSIIVVKRKFGFFTIRFFN